MFFLVFLHFGTVSFVWSDYNVYNPDRHCVVFGYFVGKFFMDIPTPPKWLFSQELFWKRVWPDIQVGFHKDQVCSNWCWLILVRIPQNILGSSLFVCCMLLYGNKMGRFSSGLWFSLYFQPTIYLSQNPLGWLIAQCEILSGKLYTPGVIWGTTPRLPSISTYTKARVAKYSAYYINYNQGWHKWINMLNWINFTPRLVLLLVSVLN